MDFYEKFRKKANVLFGTNPTEQSPSFAKDAVLLRSSGRSESDPLPSNAKPLDKRSAYAAIINNVRRQSGTDNFFLVHGTKVLSLVAAASGCVVLFCFRKAMMIKPRANFMYYAGVFLLPLGGLTTVRSKYFDEPVTLGNLGCLSCAQIRSAVLQVSAGFLYPIVCSPVAAIATARRHLTYSTVPLTRLPHGSDLVRSVFNVRRDLLIFVLIFNVIISSGIARRQYSAAHLFHVQHETVPVNSVE